MRASFDGRTDVVQALLASNAHINQQNNVIQRLNINMHLIMLSLTFHFNTSVNN